MQHGNVSHPLRELDWECRFWSFHSDGDRFLFEYFVVADSNFVVSMLRKLWLMHTGLQISQLLRILEDWSNMEMSVTLLGGRIGNVGFGVFILMGTVLCLKFLWWQIAKRPGPRRLWTWGAASEEAPGIWLASTRPR